MSLLFFPFLPLPSLLPYLGDFLSFVSLEEALGPAQEPLPVGGHRADLVLLSVQQGQDPRQVPQNRPGGTGWSCGGVSGQECLPKVGKCYWIKSERLRFMTNADREKH